MTFSGESLFLGCFGRFLAKALVDVGATENNTGKIRALSKESMHALALLPIVAH